MSARNLSQWLSNIMKKDLIAGAFIASIALAAPIGLVVVEGTIRPIGGRQPVKAALSTASSKLNAPQTRSLAVTQMPELPPFTAAESLVPNLDNAATLSAEAPSATEVDLDIHVTGDRIAETSPTAAEVTSEEPVTLVAAPPDSDQQPTESDPAHADQVATLTELVQYSAVGNDSQFQPAVTPVDVVAAPAEPQPAPIQNAVQAGGVRAAPADPNDEKMAAQFEKELAGKKGGAKVGVVEQVKKPNKEKDEIKNARCNVSLMRPLKDIVRPMEGIVGKGLIKGFPVVLVRPKEVGAEWWSQESAPRQGIYFRAIARFGNGTTPEGSRFKLIVAYVPREADLPEIGAQFTTLPADWVVSQEFEVVLRRN